MLCLFKMIPFGYIIDYEKTLQFLNNSYIIGLNDKIVNKTIEIRKSFKIKIPDAIIAATALTGNFILYSSPFKMFLKAGDLVS